MLPTATHDEESWQTFTQSLREHVTGTLTAGNKKVYETSAKKTFEKREGRIPSTRQEVRKLMIREPYHQYWSALMRTTQEVMWDSVGNTVERESDALIKRSRVQRSTGGTLN